MNVAGKKFMLLIADTSGSEESYELRNSSYSGAHVFIICYSINNEQSWNNATEKVRRCLNFEGTSADTSLPGVVS
jgi:GTPase SAR1 family protein